MLRDNSSSARKPWVGVVGIVSGVVIPLAIMAYAFASSLRSVWISYDRLLLEQPVVTKSLTAGFIGALSDFVAQRFEGKRNYDYARTMRMSAIGLFIAGPVTHHYLNLLERVVPGRPSLPVVLKKIVIDQTMFGPVMLCTCFTALGLMEGQSLSGISSKLRRDFISTQTRGMALWSCANMISFGVVPLHLRPVFGGLVGFCWNIYVSSVANKHHPHQSAPSSTSAGGSNPAASVRQKLS
eukprot:Opistho-2@65859